MSLRSHPDTTSAEIAATAARLVVEDGLDFGSARRRALHQLGLDGLRLPVPDHQQLEDAVRAHLQLFRADSHARELRALRELARDWLQRLNTLRPHLSGAVWRGTATRLSDIEIDLYCDDPKAAEIELLNQGLNFQTHGGSADAVAALSLRSKCPLGPVTVVLFVRDLDAMRGALKPGAGGRTLRGALPALQRLLDQDSA